MRRKLGLGAAVLLLALILVGIRSLDAPIVLYPASASLPTGPYLRSFETVDTGKIVAFAVPDAARRYQMKRGENVPPDFLFMKPIVAGPGDLVCNSLAGLWVNGERLAATASHDQRGELLPLWQGCRPLADDQYFMVSDRVPNSFDGRYFGPIEAADIVGVYRPLF
jgi:conjugative transfer signal peptidase TraF